MPENLTISVITVCLNASSSIRRTIESVIHQTRKPFEYIIIDGGSTDGTLEIIHEYRDCISHLVSEKDKGISDAFNKGIQLCSGDVIGILNADDWYESETLQRVADHMGEGDLLHGKLQYWRNGKKDYLAEGNHLKLSKEMTIHHPTIFVRKILYQECGLYRVDYKYAMDYELALRFFLKSKRFVYVPETLANMSFNGASDMNWNKAIRESKYAKLDNGLDRISSYIYYMKQIFRSYIARLLKRLGLNRALKMYRKHFALVRKT